MLMIRKSKTREKKYAIRQPWPYCHYHFICSQKTQLYLQWNRTHTAQIDFPPYSSSSSCSASTNIISIKLYIRIIFQIEFSKRKPQINPYNYKLNNMRLCGSLIFNNTEFRLLQQTKSQTIISFFAEENLMIWPGILFRISSRFALSKHTHTHKQTHEHIRLFQKST